MVNLGSELEQALALFQLIHFAMFELLKKSVLFLFLLLSVCLFVFFTSECTVRSKSLLYCLCTFKSTVTVNIFTKCLCCS